MLFFRPGWNRALPGSVDMIWGGRASVRANNPGSISYLVDQEPTLQYS